MNGSSLSPSPATNRQTWPWLAINIDDADYDEFRRGQKTL
jgi:hypothetical protein